MNIEDAYYAGKQIICENKKLTSYDASFVIDKDNPNIQKYNEVIPRVYTTPFLSAEFCKELLEESIRLSTKEDTFEVNPTEVGSVQVPEFNFKKVPGVYNLIIRAVKENLVPIFNHLWGRAKYYEATIQIANYSPKEISEISYHFDSAGDVSVVVPLNTGEYEGGGTEFLNRGIVEPLPNGTALFFDSFTNKHRGLAVTKGQRYLLVMWIKGYNYNFDLTRE